MSNELDPHHLVALMSHIFGDKQAGSSRRLDISSLSFKHGIVDNQPTNFRTLPILDAIANISVSRARHQVIAVALQLDHQKEEMCLTIAENQDVRKGLPNHLRNVWRNLQTLSNEYASQRGPDKPEYQLETPPMPEGVALTLKKQIFRDIYLYSAEKQMRRIKKWFHELGIFVKALVRRRGFSNLQGFEVNLYNAVLALLRAMEPVFKLRDNSSSQLTNAEWAKVYNQSMKANEDVRVVLDARDGTECEVLAEELKDDHEDLFNLRRALVKLTSLPHHIESLFGFAHSPCLRPAFLYRLSVISVRRRLRNIQLPPSQEEWNTLLVTACQLNYNWQNDEAKQLFKMFGSRKYKCAVHCECKLIHYLQTTHKNQWDNVPPFPYIGVSKLSCPACRIWIKAFNKLGGRQFYTRGAHGKWYWPWGMPNMEGPLREVVAKKVLKEYIAHKTASGLLRSQSESSGASPAGAQHGLDDDQREEAVADTAYYSKSLEVTACCFLTQNFRIGDEVVPRGLNGRRDI